MNKEGNEGGGVHNLGGGGTFAERGVLEEEQVCRVKSPVSDTLRCLWDVKIKGR